MTPEQLAEIKARATAATPGPWVSAWEPFMGTYDSGGERNPDVAFIGPEDLPEAVTIAFGLEGENPYDSPSLKANAAFIAHARADIPALVAEVERLQMIEQAAKKFIEAQGAKKIGAHYDLSVTLGYIHPSGF